VLLGVFVSFLADFTLLEGLLLGAVVSSTDAEIVFSILRSKSIGLKRNLRPTLELESGSNDPMAYFLTISLTYLLVNPDTSFVELIPSFFIQMALGSAGGYLMGKAMVWIMNHINLQYDGLYTVLLLAMVVFTYSGINYIQGNGFLAVYIAGVVMGNSRFLHKKSLLRFYDGISWLMQILMFPYVGFAGISQANHPYSKHRFVNFFVSDICGKAHRYFYQPGVFPDVCPGKGLHLMGRFKRCSAYYFCYLPTHCGCSQIGDDI